MKALARALRRLADRLDPIDRPMRVTINVAGSHQASLGREIARAIERHQRATGRMA